jgi:cytochrome P450
MSVPPPTVREPSHWLTGPAYYAQRNPLRWLSQWFKDYGDIYTIKAPFGQATVLGDPELARQVLVDRYAKYPKKSRSYVVLRLLMGNGLVTSDGEFWRGQRRLVQPAFHRRRLDALFAMMVERVTDRAARIGGAAGRAVDFVPQLSHLTLEIIARAMFSTDVGHAAAGVGRHITKLNEYALLLLRNPHLFLIPRPLLTRLNPSLRALNRIVHGIIRARRTQGDTHDDLLSMLLAACDEETGRGMTDEQLRDEVMTIFIAGHETTANAMAWLMCLVAQHAAVEERLLAEIDAQWSEEGLTLAQLASFPYVRQVIEESLRVYPTIWSVGRNCVEEDDLGGYSIPREMNMVVPIFHFHWSEKFWPEPQKFDPDRFAPERRPSNESMTYFPFGAGPRSCIGNHFAMQELMIMTVIFYRHFRFRLEPGFKVEADPLITLRPKFGMRLIPETRRPLSPPAAAADSATQSFHETV